MSDQYRALLELVIDDNKAVGHTCPSTLLKIERALAQPAEAVEGAEGVPFCPTCGAFPGESQRHDAAQVAIHQLDTMRRIIDQAVAWTEARREEEKLPTDEDSNIEWPHFCRVGQMKNWSNTMQAAIRLLAGGAAQGAVAWIFERMHVVRYADEAHGIEGAVEWRPEASVEYPHALVRQEWARNVRPLTHPQAAPAQGGRWKLVPVEPTEAMRSAGERKFLDLVQRIKQANISASATDFWQSVGYNPACEIHAAMLAAAPSQEGES